MLNWKRIKFYLSSYYHGRSSLRKIDIEFKIRTLAMKRLLPVTLFFLTLFANLIAQGFQLRGRVEDTSGAAVPNPVVRVQNKTIGGNPDGSFTVELPDSGIIEFKINADGYFQVTRTFRAVGRDTTVTFLLSPKVYHFEEVVVTASRSEEFNFEQPQAILAIRRDALDYYQPATTAEILRNQTKIEIQKTTHSGGAPIIRGMFGKRVLILADGIRLNNSTYRTGTNPYLNTIPKIGVYRLELLEGPSSIMYGSDALGGVLNVITKPESDYFQRLSISSQYSSADNGVTFGYRSANHVGNGRLSLAFQKSDIGDLRGGGDVGEQTPSGWTDLGGCLYFEHPIGNSFDIESGLQAYKAEDIPRYDRYTSGKYDFYLYDPRERYLGFIRVNNSGLLGMDGNSFAISYQKQREGRRYSKSSRNETTYQDVDVKTIHADINSRKYWSATATTTMGAELYSDRVDSWRKENIEDSTIISTIPPVPDGSEYLASGVYLLHQWQPFERLNLRHGFRYSHFQVRAKLESPYGILDENYADLSFSTGAVFELSKSLNLVSNVSRGFRAPNIDDLTKFEISAAGREVPSPDLIAEHSYQLDIGLKWLNQNTEGEIFLWGAILTDFINRDAGTYNGLTFWDENGNGEKDPGEDLILIKVNSDKFYMSGAQLRTEFKLSESFSTSAGFSYTWGENADTGEPMSKIPPFMGRLSLSYQKEFIDRAEVFAQFASRQDRLSDLDKEDNRINPDGTPSWATLNFHSKIKLGQRFKLICGIENIFDTAYKRHASGIYSPGINFKLGLQYTLD
ncbi:MAG: TonB-dependent receptor plug domain-containing protein [candidate division Zixibacteria bacterium]|nr:TonB-dependent receptor plug domain-containing protein [candidate division Zixibacteria bacterium]